MTNDEALALAAELEGFAEGSTSARASLMRDAAQTIRSLIPEPPTEALDLLDEMNQTGRISYSDYSALHDAVSVLIPEPPTDDEREALRKANGPLSIERLREIGNAATPGPWAYDGYGADEPEINAWAHRYIRNTDADANGLYREIATSEDGHGPNAEFIVHARNFWNELLDELAMWRNRHRGPITDDERAAIADLLRQHMSPRSDRVDEWPEDEAEAYRELRWEEGRKAAFSLQVSKAVDALVASTTWRNRHRGPVTDEAVAAALDARAGMSSVHHYLYSTDKCRCGEEWTDAHWMRYILEAAEATH